MILAVLLSAALIPQATPAASAEEAPPQAAPATEAAPETPGAPAPSLGAVGPHIDAGLAAFRRRRLAAARAEFEQAVAADPQSAAAAFYLGYTLYKLGEPSHRMNERKERAKELFAKAFSLDPTFTPAWGGK